MPKQSFLPGLIITFGGGGEIRTHAPGSAQPNSLANCPLIASWVLLHIFYYKAVHLTPFTTAAFVIRSDFFNILCIRLRGTLYLLSFYPSKNERLGSENSAFISPILTTSLLRLAEGLGLEPRMAFDTNGGFQDRCLANQANPPFQPRSKKASCLKYHP